MPHSKELKLALTAAREASAIIMRYYGKSFKIHHKGEINLVTEVDQKAQKAIFRRIRKTFKNDAVLAEEGDLSQTQSAPRRWIVDPLDGTTNFAHGYPRFCVSIAFELEGIVQCGVVMDPVMKEVFWAQRGSGAFLNKKRLHVSKISELRKSLLVTGFPYDLDHPDYNNIPYFVHMIRAAQAVRRDGSAALNIAYVAAGRFEGFWELSLQPWDYAAGLLLVEEAGGLTRHLSGRPWTWSDHAILAANPLIYEALLRELKLARAL